MVLHETTWPLESPRGAVALVHGAGEHAGRYGHVARAMNDAGYAVLAHDLPGFGRSPGRRGHIEHFEAYLQTVDGMLRRLCDLYPGAAHFLYGHSMGGTIVVRWLQTRLPVETGRLAGVVLTSPALDLSLPVSPALLRAARVLEHVWPTMAQPTRIPASAVSRSPEVVAAYAADPLVERGSTVRWAMEFQRAMAAARTGEADFPMPALILQAGDDRLVSPAATRAFAERLRAPLKEYREFPGWYHEIHNEPERDEILGRITSFLDAALALDPGSPGAAPA